MKEISLSGVKRAAVGKKASKELRKEGLVPCNIYGNGSNMSFAIAAADLRKAIYTPNVYIINLDIEGEKKLAILKELQFHPVKDNVMHVDFLEITAEKPVTIGIPVKLVGLAQGVRDGGRMNLSIRKINVTGLIQNLPDTLEVDVTPLTIGKSIKVGQLSYENLEMATGKEVIVCSIKATRKSIAAKLAAQ